MSREPATAKPAQQDTLVLVDEQDNPVGSAPKVDCHVGHGLLHRAFSVFLFNPVGELLIQQRSPAKMLWGGYWANSCCSHPRLGEDTLAAAQRRIQEELGLSCELRFLYKFIYHARFGEVGSEHENCWVFAGKVRGEPTVNPDEIAAWRYINPTELTRALDAGEQKFAPWFRLEWERIRQDFLPEIV